MPESKWKTDLFPYIPERARQWIWALDDRYCEKLEEIRFRAQRPVQLIGGDFEVLLETCIPDEKTLSLLMENLNEHSAYIYEQERSEGFFTLPGGYRVGISGRRGAQDSIGCINGCNIRIAKEWRGCADELMRLLCDQKGIPLSALLLSSPGVGKTTMLRDIARQFSNGDYPTIKKVAIADERSEIAGCRLGVPTLDVGKRTDVMDAYPKAKAIRMLIRSMSPNLIVTDEVGGEEDAEALCEAGRCGVCVIASAHAPDAAAARGRKALLPLLDSQLFERVIELYRQNGIVRFRVA